MLTWSEIYRCLFDAFMVVWFFVPVKERRSLPDATKVACFFLLLLTAPIYIISGERGALVAVFRCIYRTGIYSLWLLFRKKTTLKDSVYFSALCWISFTAQNNIFLTPQLSALRWNQVAWTSSLFVNRSISLGLELFAEFLILTLISRSFPFEEERSTDAFRIGAAAIVVICQLYVKATLKAMTEALPMQYVSELTIYPILLQLILTASLVLVERYLSTKDRQERDQMAEIATRYRLETAQTKADADTDLRQLHHDMKNHLLGLRQLAGDNGKLEDYIDNLLQTTSEYDYLVDTGNPLLDGLISEKLRRADKENIEMSVAIDFRQGDFISDMDLCAIFGNALDNAIEASSKVVAPDKRSILIKCSSTAGNMILTVMNYYDGELKKDGERLLSSKSSSGHGIGLSSIRRTAEKYGGIMTVSTDEYHNFVLRVLLPIP